LILSLFLVGVGAHICGISNVIPETVVKIRDYVNSGMYKDALALQFQINEIKDIIRSYKLDIAPYKCLMKLRGIDAGVPSKPLRPLSKDECASLLEEVSHVLRILTERKA
jgi:dihydrodipicolinate synthase/N-acetylneuraminate lyase